MTKRPRAAEQDSPPNEMAQDGAIPRWLKITLSILLMLHLLAVFAPPFAVATSTGPTSSPLADRLFGALRPYIAAMYLDHGYFFFAPNPAETHLVDYKLEFDDGRPPIEGRFPDLKTERPRLLYHRYFMMSEALNSAFAPPIPPPEPSPPPLTATAADKLRYQAQKREYAAVLAAWKHRRRQYESLWNAYEDHLKAAYGASSVTLTRVEHRPADPGEISVEKKRLDDPASYRNMLETAPPAREALRAPLAPRGELPQPEKIS